MAKILISIIFMFLILCSNASYSMNCPAKYKNDQITIEWRELSSSVKQTCEILWNDKDHKIILEDNLKNKKITTNEKKETKIIKSNDSCSGTSILERINCKNKNNKKYSTNSTVLNSKVLQNKIKECAKKNTYESKKRCNKALSNLRNALEDQANKNNQGGAESQSQEQINKHNNSFDEKWGDTPHENKSGFQRHAEKWGSYY
jgi:hypothetical protein